MSPPASTAGRRCGSPVVVRPARAVARRATCTSTCGSPPTTATCATSTISSPYVSISIAQAALGTSLELETLDGTEHLIVPAGTQPGREFVLRQRGVPHLRGRGRGDLRARVRVDVPKKLTDRELELLTEFAEGRGEVVGNAKEGFFSRIKSAFS